MSKSLGSVVSTTTRCAFCNIHISAEPVVLLACGSFNPITTMHLRMMELARDKIERTWSICKANKDLAGEDGCMMSISTPSNAKPPPFNAIGSVCSKYEADDVIPHRQVVVGGVISPVSDGYNKPNLVPAQLRVEMARLACVTSSDWLAVSTWESDQSQWSRTRVVVDQLQSVLDRVYGQVIKPPGVILPAANGENIQELPLTCSSSGTTSKSGLFTESWLRNCLNSIGFPCTDSSYTTDDVHLDQSASGTDHRINSKTSGGSPSSVEAPISRTYYPRPRVKLVCGADLLESFAVPNLWSKEDMEVLVRDYGIVCISRPQSDAARFVFESDILSKYEDNIFLVTEWCQNALSATMVRRALSLGRSVRYLVPDAVLEKIYDLGLYNAKRPSRNLVWTNSTDTERHRRGGNAEEPDNLLLSGQT